MPGLLYPAYQKLYSALSHLERFNKESNFFDNIAAFDGFFNEYRNITFVMQSSLKHTNFFDVYEKNKKRFLTDHWFVEKRNETIKQKPFALIKEVKIAIYLPFGGFTVSEQTFSIENDEPLETLIEDIKSVLCQVDPHEVYFSVSFSFHEEGSDIDLLKKLLQGVFSMREFMEAMDQDIEEECPLCEQLKKKIQEFHTAYLPLDFLLTNDYTYYPENDCFDKAEMFAMIFGQGKTVIARHPLSMLTHSPCYYDGTAFGNFTLLHAMLRVMKPGMDIMPTIMVVYDDDTYSLDTFNTTMKTTMYRKINETAQLIAKANVIEVCFICLYARIPLSSDTPRTSRERLQISTSDLLVCASIDNELNEKEYLFDGKCMENIDYVAYTMKNGLKNELAASARNLSPIKRAFMLKKNVISE